jgi:hypothetical protein
MPRGHRGHDSDPMIEGDLVQLARISRMHFHGRPDRTGACVDLLYLCMVSNLKRASDWFVSLTLLPTRAIAAELRGLYPIVARHLWATWVFPTETCALKGVYLVRCLPA